MKPSTTLWPVIDAVVSLDGHFDALEDADGVIIMGREVMKRLLVSKRMMYDCTSVETHLKLFEVPWWGVLEAFSSAQAS